MTGTVAEETLRVVVPLPAGDAPVRAAYGAVPGATGIVAIAHGAGSAMDHPFLLAFAAALRAEGLATMRFNFPYSEAGRRMPGPAGHAVLTWREIGRTAAELVPGRMLACGKSYGGRMASMAVAEGMAASGLAYLGYPFHPPGKPESTRAAHLPAIGVPQLFVEGSNDPFIQPVADFEAAVGTCQDARIVWVDGGGHSFEVKGRRRPAQEIGASLAPIVAEFAAAL